MVYDHQKRLTAAEALSHPYFTQGEIPEDFDKFKEDFYGKLKNQGAGSGKAVQGTTTEAEDAELLRGSGEGSVSKKLQGRTHDENDPFAEFPFKVLSPADLESEDPEALFKDPERKLHQRRHELSPEKKREMEKKRAKERDQADYYTDDPLMEYSDARQPKF